MSKLRFAEESLFSLSEIYKQKIFWLDDSTFYCFSTELWFSLDPHVISCSKKKLPAKLPKDLIKFSDLSMFLSGEMIFIGRAGENWKAHVVYSNLRLRIRENFGVLLENDVAKELTKALVFKSDCEPFDSLKLIITIPKNKVEFVKLRLFGKAWNKIIRAKKLI